MQFSKWHALGNSYLVVEQPDAGPLDAGARAAALLGRDGNRLRRRARGHRGATDASAAVTIWNPDGSTAEMSGNGVRIAARWLAAETGATEVTIETAGRRVAARMLNTLDTDTDVGEFSRRRARAARRDRVDNGLGREPTRSDPARRSDARRPPPPRPARRDARPVPRSHERPARPRRRAARPDGARLGAGSGGDERVGLVIRRRRSGRRRARMVRQPCHRAPAGRRSPRADRRRAGVADRAGRTGGLGDRPTL